MSLTARAPETKVVLREPAYVLADHHDPDWIRVEKVASRFHLMSHRRAVRVYLYATVRDVEALRRFAEDLMKRRKLRAAHRRGRELLEEARRLYPEVFGALMEEFVASTPSRRRRAPRAAPATTRRR
jgi:hypothetical protein